MLINFIFCRFDGHPLRYELLKNLPYKIIVLRAKLIFKWLNDLMEDHKSLVPLQYDAIKFPQDPLFHMVREPNRSPTMRK